jgi:hypothetical protein
MKYLSVLCLMALVSCAHQRGPASANGQPVAHDSMALGNVQASAVKKIEQQDVCFDVTLKMKGVSREQAQPSNWTLAWVDNKNQYHLLNPSARHPASVPQGGPVVMPYGAYNEWSNNFIMCAPKARMDDVKGIVLTPKDLPYKDVKSLQLNF